MTVCWLVVNTFWEWAINDKCREARRQELEHEFGSIV
jgi:hypothetical protein